MSSIPKRTQLASQLSHDDRGLGCVAYDQQVLPTYGYKPNTAAGIVFVVVFFITFLTHCVQTAVKRKWWYSLLAVGALGTTFINASRQLAANRCCRRASGLDCKTLASKCPYSNAAFEMQISVLIICTFPTPSSEFHVTD